MPGQSQVDDARSHRKYHRNQALQQEPRAKARGKYKRPKARMKFLFIQSTEKCPHGQRSREREHDIGNQNSGEQEQTDAGRGAEAGIESRPFAKSPDAKSSGEPTDRQ